MIHNQRMFAQMSGGEFVVFLIGARVNRWWKIHKWLPITQAMPKMLRELIANPELGLLGYEMFPGRTTLMIQYWRSMDHLIEYARARDSEHLPAWSDFNRRVGTNGDVGIWHETYVVKPGQYENIYTNMPPFGLGRVGELRPISERSGTARERIAHAA